jgi:hypothetical protein
MKKVREIVFSTEKQYWTSFEESSCLFKSAIQSQFLQLLRQAIVQIKEPYFLIEPYECHEKHFERIYCYELYHQMRKVTKEKCFNEYVFHGEYDKRGSDKIKKILGHEYKPDFIAHKPRTQDNLAIIEVKTTHNLAGVKKDIRKIGEFVNLIDYQIGIMLIFGKVDNRNHKMKTALPEETVILWHNELNNVLRFIDSPAE